MGLPTKQTYELNCDICGATFWSEAAFPKPQYCDGCFRAQLAAAEARVKELEKELEEKIEHIRSRTVHDWLDGIAKRAYPHKEDSEKDTRICELEEGLGEIETIADYGDYSHIPYRVEGDLKEIVAIARSLIDQGEANHER